MNKWIILRLRFLVCLATFGLSGCSKSSKSTIEPFPILGKTYTYAGDSLVASFDYKITSEKLYYSELFGGNVTHQSDGKYERYTLKGGAISFRNKKDNSEVARLSSDTIVWYGLPEKQ